MPEVTQPEIFLNPGEIYIAEKPTIISTILGSCVAITLFNPRLGMAAMCHALLPHCDQHRKNGSHVNFESAACQICREPFKYVDCSFILMSDAFFRFGIRPQETEIKLFGGAQILIHERKSQKSATVGEQNIEAALQLLADSGLTLAASNVGGKAGRKIYFNTKTGEILLRRLGRTVDNNAIKAKTKKTAAAGKQ